MEIDQTVRNIPIFLRKLWKIVNDENSTNIIEWNETGDGFVIHDQIQFMLDYLPKYFKHNNLSSFIRQLNLYGFHKVANIDKNEMQFTHQYFMKDVPQLLALIKRKPVLNKGKLIDVVQPSELEQLVENLKHLKTRHRQVENELKSLKQENAALWSEISSLRLKYVKHSKVINKLIQFLVSYMQTHNNVPTLNRKQVKQKSSGKLENHQGPTIFELDSNGCPKEFWRKFDESNSYPMKEQEESPGPSREEEEEIPESDADMDVDDQPIQFILKGNQLIQVTPTNAKPDPVNEQEEDVEEPQVEECGTVVVTSDGATPRRLLHDDDDLQIDVDSLQDILNNLNKQEVDSIYRMFESDWPPKSTENSTTSTELNCNENDNNENMEVANLPSDEVNDLDFDLYSVMPEIRDLLNSTE